MLPMKQIFIKGCNCRGCLVDRAIREAFVEHMAIRRDRMFQQTIDERRERMSNGRDKDDQCPESTK